VLDERQARIGSCGLPQVKDRTLQRTKKKTERGDLALKYTPISNTQNGTVQPKRDPAFIQYTYHTRFSFRSFLAPL